MESIGNGRRFVIRRSSDKQSHFILSARNSEVCITSETYTSKQSAQGGILVVREVAPTAT